MKTSPWIAALALAAGLCACGGDAPPGEPVVGEVRGAPLRSPRAAEPEPDVAAVAEAGAPAPPEPEPAAEPEPDPLGEDYADLLPEGEAAQYEWIDFPLLMDFDFPGLVTDEVEPEDLEPPEEVRELDGRKVAIEGFMNPLSFDAEGVSEFTLVSDPTFCCFGMTPQLNHFVHVTLPEGERCDFYSMVPVAVFGTFSVGAELEDGIVLSLYRMEAKHVLSVY